MGHLKNTNFPFGIYGISMVLSVPTLKHFRVFPFQNNPMDLDPSHKMDLDLWDV